MSSKSWCSAIFVVAFSIISASAAPRPSPGVSIRVDDGETHPKFESCLEWQKEEILKTIEKAQAYANDAYSYLVNHKASSERYITWFGKSNETRYEAVLRNFETIKAQNFSNYTYDCSLVGCTEAANAYVYPEQYGIVHLCPAFWPAPTSGTSSKAGTIIHEASHFVDVAKTVDVVNKDSEPYYGKTKCKNLARGNPDNAIKNADSYEFFAENDPPLRKLPVEIELDSDSIAGVGDEDGDVQKVMQARSGAWSH